MKLEAEPALAAEIPIDDAAVAGDAGGLYYATRVGTWTSNYHAGSTSPNISDARSSAAGSIYQIRNNAGASRPALSDVKLHFTGTADGVIRWRCGWLKR